MTKNRPKSEITLRFSRPEDKSENGLKCVKKTPLKRRKKFSKLEKNTPKAPLLKKSISNWEKKVKLNLSTSLIEEGKTSMIEDDA